MNLRLRDATGFILFMLFLTGCIGFTCFHSAQFTQGIIAISLMLLTTAICVWCMVGKTPEHR